MTPAVFQHPAIRPFKIRGDVMQPTLRSGDFLMVQAAARYDGEGVYILDFNGEGGTPYRAERIPVAPFREVKIWHDNPAYSRHVIDLEEFDGAVRAKVVAEVHMKVGLHELARACA
jgi:signal peptidase I